MSVINTMLRKLDARGVERPALAVPPAAFSPPPASPRWRLPTLVAIGGAAIAATAFADWPRAFGLDGGSMASHTVRAEPVEAQVGTSTSSVRRGSEAGDVAASAAAPASAANLPKPTQLAPAAAARSAALPELAPPLPRIDKRSAGADGSQRAAALYRSAHDAAQSGHARLALQGAHDALAADPSHAPSRLLAAMLEHETGATDRAVALLRDGLARSPADPAPMALLLARLLAGAGDDAGALAVLDRHQLSDAAAQGLRAALHARAGQWTAARDAYEHAARQQPANAAWWFGLALALDAQSDTERARQAYTRARAIGLPQQDQAAYAEQRLRALE